ncbi:hypothetical protein IKF74_02930 [Candidatus Saccharibacteria bacterium]|nr:hypothetical protein [Candidatus Saccharibacteria bacterium]
MWKRIKKLFGGINMTWQKVILLAVILGIYTAIVAMLIPDGNSLHDIAVTAEWWVLPAIIIIVNCKKPLEAALKTFVFFLISQPLVYLVQVPFSSMGWGLFGYYKFWFIVTLLTFPGAFLGWFIKKDKWYSGIILAIMTAFLGITGVSYIQQLLDHFPNHLLSILYCFGIIPVLILTIFKDKKPRLICASITVVATVIFALFVASDKPYETYNNTFVEQNNITFVGEPWISFWQSESGKGKVEIINPGDGTYTFKLSGTGSSKYQFAVSDDQNEYYFEYYFDKEQNTVVVNKIDNRSLEPASL